MSRIYEEKIIYAMLTNDKNILSHYLFNRYVDVDDIMINMGNVIYWYYENKYDKNNIYINFFEIIHDSLSEENFNKEIFSIGYDIFGINGFIYGNFIGIKCNYDISKNISKLKKINNDFSNYVLGEYSNKKYYYKKSNHDLNYEKLIEIYKKNNNKNKIKLYEKKYLKNCLYLMKIMYDDFSLNNYLNTKYKKKYNIQIISLILNIK